MINLGTKFLSDNNVENKIMVENILCSCAGRPEINSYRKGLWVESRRKKNAKDDVDLLDIKIFNLQIRNSDSKKVSLNF